MNQRWRLLALWLVPIALDLPSYGESVDGMFFVQGESLPADDFHLVKLL